MHCRLGATSSVVSHQPLYIDVIYTKLSLLSISCSLSRFYRPFLQVSHYLHLMRWCNYLDIEFQNFNCFLLFWVVCFLLCVFVFLLLMLVNGFDLWIDDAFCKLLPCSFELSRYWIVLRDRDLQFCLYIIVCVNELVCLLC